MYHPSTPPFNYTDPSTVCRVQAIANTATGKLTEELQCAESNSSLTAASQDSTAFWTYQGNWRNNNASFPLGANCFSLMLRDGSVDTDLKAACSANPTAVLPTVIFTTFMETPLVIIYLVYLSLFAFFHERDTQLAKDIDKKLLATPHTFPMLGASETYGRRTSIRASDVQMQATASGEILQIGFSNSFFGSTAIFFVVWVFALLWFVGIMSAQDRILNFFRQRTPLNKCEFVYMFKRDETEVLLADRSGVSDFVAKVESFFASKGKISGYRTTVPVVEVDGLRIVEFQHIRYVYEETEQRFVPGVVALGRTYDDMQQEASGLSDTEARHRINTVGSNSVDVEMPSLPVSMAQEFFTLFYIYQIMCYYVWYYFTYWNMGIVMTVVVLGAAVVNIYTQRQIQSSIVKMTRYRTDVTAFRAGEWRVLSSPYLASGDLVKVSENWVVPCDMAIVKGTTVCDESMLTGESMPVQKFPIPEHSSEVYDPEKGSKKHTLFAGTRVLSSGRNEEILAIVQTTGAHTTKGQLIQSILFPIPMRFKYNEHLKVLIALLP
ncbi:E1-E2 ATPase [Phytophthora infestans]|uniref:E1-E2 ATPase n=1 Tax=Phytophthora infestans TaxID=4787 RepID=A0A8S9V2I1_PHYIN|nr:E1-E2 ATPase [Phytophthora infestans]KAI9981763.1 hypothetical protein PInf_009533 [Phytophthora infestans]